MIAPKTAQNDAQAKAMLAKGVRLQGIPGKQKPMDGMVAEVDGRHDLPDHRFGRQARRVVGRQRRCHPDAGDTNRRWRGGREVDQGGRPAHHREESADGDQGDRHPLTLLRGGTAC